jgi:hypothetical protein
MKARLVGATRVRLADDQRVENAGPRARFPRRSSSSLGFAGTTDVLGCYLANADRAASAFTMPGKGDHVMKKLCSAVASAALLFSSTAFAQTTPPTQPATPPAAAEPMPPVKTTRQPAMHTPIRLTEAEAKSLIDATVVSSDNKNVGEVAAIQRDSDGRVTELQADIGGFLGIGQSRVRLLPSQFTVSDKRILLTLTAAQVGELPKLEK